MEIATMLELEGWIETRTSNLASDNKQKISMEQRLVGDDVNVIMFDEPLMVIDPTLKWKLRPKLKELYQKIAVTMIYVTHDQPEALTFVDQVFVFFFSGIGILAVIETGYPGGDERQDILGLTTTRGDRLFIGLLGPAHVLPAWLDLVVTPRWWPLGLAIGWLVLCFWQA